MTLTRLDRYGAERSALGTEGGGVTAGTRLTANAEEEEEEREEGIGAHPPTRGPIASEGQGGATGGPLKLRAAGRGPPKHGDRGITIVRMCHATDCEGGGIV